MSGRMDIEAAMQDASPDLMRSFLIAFLSLDVAVAVSVTDWLLKSLLRENAGQELVPGFIALTNHHNYGLLANLPLPLWQIVALSLIALVALLYAYRGAWRARSLPQCLSLSLIFGGAIGNLSDRLLHGYVFDYLMFFNTSILNFADIAIGLGLLLYVFTSTQKSPNMQI